MASALLTVVLLATTTAAAAVAIAFVPTDPSADEGYTMEHYQMDRLAATLTDLGYQELAKGVQSLYESSPDLAAWSGPVTVFAPSDDFFLHSYGAPILRLLRLHLAQGLHSAADLARLPSGFKLETAGDGEGPYLTVTSIAAAAGSKIFIEGVEITRPDLFNDGRIAIHGLRGFLPPFSPLSYAGDPNSSASKLLEALVALDNRGYGILALEMSLLDADLPLLDNMTVFALDDQSIHTGGGDGYVSNVPFHIVPDRLLMHADLARLPRWAVLPTLASGRSLAVTRSASAGATLLQINGVSIKVPDLFCNAKIAIHGITMPFFPVDTEPADQQVDPGLFLKAIVMILKAIRLFLILTYLVVRTVVPIIPVVWIIWLRCCYARRHRRRRGRQD